MIRDIDTSGYKVIESNAVILFNKDSDLKLHFCFEKFEFDVVFSFKTIKEQATQEVNKEITGSTIKYECINFDNELGTGTIEPIDMATVNSKKLYIHFWSFVMGEVESDRYSRKVEYTVFMER